MFAYLFNIPNRLTTKKLFCGFVSKSGRPSNKLNDDHCQVVDNLFPTGLMVQVKKYMKRKWYKNCLYINLNAYNLQNCFFNQFGLFF